MVAAKMSLATSICAVLALLHLSMATANKGVPRDKPASGSALYRGISDVILLSLNESWKEGHSTFARWIQMPITTWSVQNEAFADNYITAIKGSRKPVFFMVDTMKKPPIREILHVKWFTFSSAFLFSSRPDIRAFLANNRRKERGAEFKAGYLTLNETSMQRFLWPIKSSEDQEPGSKSKLGNPTQFDGYRVQSRGGSRLRVACVSMSRYKATADICNDTSVIETLAFLNRRNVTVHLKQVPDPLNIFGMLNQNMCDLALFPVPMGEGASFFSDFAMTFIARGNFYSRVDPHRVVSLLEVAGESLNVVSTTVVLLALVVLASVVMGNKHWSFLKDIFDTALFLLAAVLATSAVEPTIRGRARIARKALIGLWLVSLLPLSVYFRTELTAIITLRRPADRIDTLQKLEDALDRRQVSPCVVKYTRNFFLLDAHPSFLPELLKKLQLEYVRVGKKELVTSNTQDCLKCASRRDRVCYISHYRSPSRSLLKRKSVAPFAQHLNMEVGAFPIRKSHRLYQPLRKYFQRVEEHKLTHSYAREPEYGTGETEIDMRGLFMLLGILHATSCLVLVLEVVVDRYMRGV